MQRILTVIVLFITFFAAAQSDPALQFNDTIHDFGSIMQSEGDIEHRFTFKNSSNDTIRISDVGADCGCTSPEWSEGPLASGDSGFVNVTYDAKTNPGPFYKVIKVYFGGDSISLAIKGFVEPKLVEDAAVGYSEKAGDIWFKTAHLHFGNIIENRTYEKTLGWFNRSDDTLIVRFDTLELYDFIEITNETDTVMPNSASKATIVYNATKREDLGYLVDEINLFPAHKNGDMKIALRATVLPYVPEMSDEELAEAPKVVVDDDSKTYNFGHVNQNDTVRYTLGLMNGGQKPLTIRKTTSGCACITTKVSEKEIASEETTRLEIVFIPKGRTSKQLKTVTVFTNDPENPFITITLSGYVRD